MVGSSYFNILKRRTRSSSRKRRCSSSRGGREMLRTTGIDSFPDDILMQILIRISAQDIVNSTKFVCRKWREITSTRDFAYAHLHRSTPGLLGTTFMSLTQGNHRVQISNFIHTSGYGYFWTSCNGLTLEPKVNDGDELMITNPVTRQHFDLPPFFAPFRHSITRSAIAYVATRKEYKVVRTYHPAGGGDQNRVHCAILTVGVDNSWRVVDTQHLSPKASFKLNYSMLVTEGFVHWVDNCGGYDNKRILSLNMETEVMTQISAPRRTDRYYHDYTYLSAVSSLSLLISVGRLKWEVWEMIKPLESGEYCWTKLTDIDLEAHRTLFNELCRKEENDPFFKYGDEDDDCLDCCVGPSGWFKYREVIAFYAFQRVLSRCRFHIVYDVQTKDVSLYKEDSCSFPHVVHTNSLVWIC